MSEWSWSPGVDRSDRRREKLMRPRATVLTLAKSKLLDDRSCLAGEQKVAKVVHGGEVRQVSDPEPSLKSTVFWLLSIFLFACARSVIDHSTNHRLLYAALKLLRYAPQFFFLALICSSVLAASSRTR